jgi:hypothetical protein
MQAQQRLGQEQQQLNQQRDYQQANLASLDDERKANAALRAQQTTASQAAAAETTRQQAAAQALMNDPSTPEPVKAFLRMKNAGAGSVPAELLKGPDQPKPDQPVMRVNPRTGQMEQIGKAPAGAHFVTEPQPPSTNAADATVQRSYDASVKAVDALAKPFTDMQPRIERLKETLNQGTPQADALVAPELLTIMAGGMGSGLRMNEAEIARIIGGRSNWETLKASVNKWQMNPASANSITPSQRQQIHALVDATQARFNKYLTLTNQAGDQLLTAKTPLEHKQIVAATKKAITELGMGTGTPTTTSTTGFKVVEIK